MVSNAGHLTKISIHSSLPRKQLQMELRMSTGRGGTSRKRAREHAANAYVLDESNEIMTGLRRTPSAIGTSLSRQTNVNHYDDTRDFSSLVLEVHKLYIALDDARATKRPEDLILLISKSIHDMMTAIAKIQS